MFTMDEMMFLMREVMGDMEVDVDVDVDEMRKMIRDAERAMNRDVGRKVTRDMMLQPGHPFAGIEAPPQFSQAGLASLVALRQYARAQFRVEAQKAIQKLDREKRAQERDGTKGHLSKGSAA